MAEHPIIFSTELVKAILDGRKTQTRRIVKDNCLQSISFEKMSPVMNSPPFYKNGEWLYELQSAVDDTEYFKLKCPYGKVGDTLYVKEGYQIWTRYYGITEVIGRYLADNTAFRLTLTKKEDDLLEARKFPRRNTPGRFMYKSLTRIFLEITNIRVERVQDINDKDVLAEGIEGDIYGEEIGISPTSEPRSARIYFMELWDSLNAKRGYGWDSNPFVWCIEFKRLEKNE